MSKDNMRKWLDLGEARLEEGVHASRVHDSWRQAEDVVEYLYKFIQNSDFGDKSNLELNRDESGRVGIDVTWKGEVFTIQVGPSAKSMMPATEKKPSEIRALAQKKY